MQKKHALQAPFEELYAIQQQLCQRSTHFGLLLQRRLGTDTLPFTLFTQMGEWLRLRDCYFFRLEEVGIGEIFVRALQAYTADGKAAFVKDAIYLEKTTVLARVSLQTIAGFQLSDVPMQQQLIESKW